MLAPIHTVVIKKQVSHKIVCGWRQRAPFDIQPVSVKSRTDCWPAMDHGQCRTANGCTTQSGWFWQRLSLINFLLPLTENWDRTVYDYGFLFSSWTSKTCNRYCYEIAINVSSPLIAVQIVFSADSRLSLEFCKACVGQRMTVHSRLTTLWVMEVLFWNLINRINSLVILLLHNVNALDVYVFN